MKRYGLLPVFLHGSSIRRKTLHFLDREAMMHVKIAAFRHHLIIFYDCVLRVKWKRMTKVDPGHEGQYQHVGSDGSPRSRL